MLTNRKRALTSAALAAALAFAGATGYVAGASAQTPDAPTAAAAPGAPQSFADIFAKVSPAVVSIDIVEKTGPSPVGFGPGSPFGAAPAPNGQNLPFNFIVPGAPQQAPTPAKASGSGFFISGDGYIVTNNHVVANAERITVHTPDGKDLEAQVVGRDAATDLAVIKVTGGPFQFVSFETGAKPRVGDWVVAVGNPFGLGGTATAGIVSALGRQNISGSSYVDYMQIDAPINHGNSGGPTFDVQGNVVGVNSAIFSPSGGSVGIGFDIPADVAGPVTQQLIADGKVTRGYIGATVQTLSPELAESMGLATPHGAVVDQLTPGGPAEQAGVHAGDIVVSIDGHAVINSADLTRQVGLVHPGDPIHLDVLRAGETHALTLHSGLRPSEDTLALNGGPSSAAPDQDSAPAALGMTLTPDPKGGLVVREIDPNSDAAAKGVRAGDVILKAGVQPLQSATDLTQAATQARQAGRKSLPLLVARGEQHLYVPVTVGDKAG